MNNLSPTDVTTEFTAHSKKDRRMNKLKNWYTSFFWYYIHTINNKPRNKWWDNIPPFSKGTQRFQPNMHMHWNAVDLLIVFHLPLHKVIKSSIQIIYMPLHKPLRCVNMDRSNSLQYKYFKFYFKSNQSLLWTHIMHII
jgi:hypothetical protein